MFAMKVDRLVKITTPLGPLLEFSRLEGSDGLSRNGEYRITVLSRRGDIQADELLGHPIDLAASLDGIPLVARSGADWWTLHPLWQSAFRPSDTNPEVAAAVRAAPEALRRRGLLHHSMRLLLALGAGGVPSAHGAHVARVARLERLLLLLLRWR